MGKPTILTQDDLILRPLEAERDAEDLHAIFGDDEQMRYMLGPALTLDQTRAQLHTWSEAVESPQWTITLDGERACGRITLVFQRKGIMEVGIQVAPAYQGRGLGTGAVVAVTEYGLEELGLGRVFADIDPENHACSRVFERAGYRREGLLQSNWATPSGYVDSLIFAATEGWRRPTTAER